LARHGRFLLSSGWDQILKAWDATTGALVCNMAMEGVESLAYHDGSGVLVTGHAQGNLCLFSLENFS
jgi:WD40 repeat protein